jgi:diguanylate cyclase (GGDEF)-like protein
MLARRCERVEVLFEVPMSKPTTDIGRAAIAHTAARRTITYQVPRPIMRRWRIASVAAAIIAQSSVMLLPGTHGTIAFAASCGFVTVAVGLSILLPRTRASSAVELLAACAYLVSLALLFRTQGSVLASLQPLVLLPIVSVALYHRPWQSAIVGLAAAGMLAAVSSLGHEPPEVTMVRAGLWTLVGAVVVFGAHNLRRWHVDALDEREEALRQARVLGDVARELNSTLDPQQVVSVAVGLAAEIASPPGLRARRANYCQISDGVVTVVAECDAEGEWVGAAWPLSEHPHLAQTVQTRHPTVGALDQLGPTVREVNRSQGVGHGGWVPVIVDGELHGVLAVAGRNRSISEQDLSRCVAIVEIMQLALSNALAHERLGHAALTDPLTSVANRRGMARLVRERRGRRPLAVLAIDVDGLKQVNDRHGHLAGDELLRLVADAIGSALRAGDVVARVGGDEFTCVVFDADEDAGAQAAARVLDAVLHSRHDDDWMASVSIGVAGVEPGAPLDLSVGRADAALYAAKQAGGMRVTVATAETVPGRARASRIAHLHLVGSVPGGASKSTTPPNRTSPSDNNADAHEQPQLAVLQTMDGHVGRERV